MAFELISELVSITCDFKPAAGNMLDANFTIRLVINDHEDEYEDAHTPEGIVYVNMPDGTYTAHGIINAKCKIAPEIPALLKNFFSAAKNNIGVYNCKQRTMKIKNIDNAAEINNHLIEFHNYCLSHLSQPHEFINQLARPSC
jgi:hypothetical protein